MNVYDFDKTIYRGASTVDFWRHCLRRYPGAARALPGPLAKALAFRQGRCSREQFKERFYQFLRFVPEAAQEAERFWDRRLIGIEPWYRAQQSNTDVIISASPDFLIGAACRRLGVRFLASPVDARSGQLLGPNCRGEEKVRRFRSAYGAAEVERFYSDSCSDAPLAALAQEAFLVRRGQVLPWLWQGKEKERKA